MQPTIQNKVTDIESIYISGGCNRSPHCLSWRNNKIIYGCCNAVNVVSTSIESNER